jgi:phenylacetate-coenzyme A ligase PaaK-like adenylate-forming protein
LNFTEIKTESDFLDFTIKNFKYQFNNNLLFRNYCKLVGYKEEIIESLQEIKFLPVELFKSNKVYCGVSDEEKIFTSSGTTGQINSKHYVKNISIYEKSFLKCFELFYGKPEDYCFLFLLPSYLERSGSSLVYMANCLIENSKNPSSGFFLNNYDELKLQLIEQKRKKEKTMLFGVTYALLDLCEMEIPLDENFIVMETGGMKGKRKEMIKEELHQILKEKFRVSKIHSEYGMTELLSQAYSEGDGIFECPPWMRIIIRDPYNPMEFLPEGKSGAINIIDLANIDSCSFLATQDLGRSLGNGKFEVLGRMNNAELRGCNLMID